MGWSLLSLLLLFLPSSRAQVNIVLVAEKNNIIPRKVIPATVEAAKRGATVIVIDIIGNTTDKQLCEALLAAKPRVVIDCTLRPRDTTNKLSARVKKVVRALGIPTVSATYGKEKSLPSWQKLTPDEMTYLVQVPPPGDTMAEVVRELVKKLKMNTVAILYDDTFVMDHKIATLLTNLNVRQTVLRLSRRKKKKEESIVQTVESIMKSAISNYFVFCNKATMKTVLESAVMFGMFKSQYSWFLATKGDFKTPPCSNCTSGSALFITADVTDDSRRKELADMGLGLEDIVDVSFYYDLAGMVLSVVTEPSWPTLTYRACTGEKLDDAMKAERIGANLEQGLRNNVVKGVFGNYVIRGDERTYQNLVLSLTRIDFIGENTSSKKLGSWSASTSALTLKSRQNLDAFKAVSYYRVTTVIQPPFVMKRILNGTEEYYGYCIDLLNELKTMANFDYSIFENAEGKFGILGTSNRWDGMMQDLISNKADIALGPISVMAEREIYVDFTIPFYDMVGISILMKRPVTQSSLFKFLTVLEPSVWGCIVASFFVTSFLMYVFDRLSPYSFHNNRIKYKDDEDQRDFNLKECLWFCLTSLTPQGGGEAPHNLSGRLVAATWWLFGFIIIASYTANLAAFWTVSRLDSTVDSMDSLAKQYKIKYLPQKGTAAASYFQRMADIEEKFYEKWKNMSLDDTLNATERAKLAVWDYPVSDKYTKIQWTIKDNKGEQDFKTFEEAVQKVKKSKGPHNGFALLADATQVRYAAMTNCDLMQVGSEFSRKPLALAVQKASDLKDRLSFGILKMQNARKLEDLKEKWWTDNPDNLKCPDMDKDGDGIGFDNLGGIFVVTALGLFLTATSLLFEYWYFTMRVYHDTVLKAREIANR